MKNKNRPIESTPPPFPIPGNAKERAIYAAGRRMAWEKLNESERQAVIFYDEACKLACLATISRKR